jgi:hypothetical protein
MPMKKSVRMKKQPRAKKVKRAKKSTRAKWWTDTPVIAGAVIVVMAAAVLIAAYQASDSGDLGTFKIIPAATVARHQAARDAVPVVFAEDTSDAAPVAEAAATPTSSPVTITGCLHRADETFRLKDTNGRNVPKARSWRSGFLKKGSASIDVIDVANRLNLSNHVGQRVSLTGTLVDREMRVRSLQRVASSCTSSPKVRI